MAYVFDNINSVMQQPAPQASNVFGAQGQQQDDDGADGQGAVQRTESAGSLDSGPQGSANKVTGGGAAQVQQKATQNYQASNPLKEIYKRNKATDVSAPDTQGISKQINQSVASAQDEANKYYEQARQVDTITADELEGIKRGEDKAKSEAQAALLPQAATVDQFALKSQGTPKAAEDIQTLTGLRDYLKSSRAGDTKGTASLDTTFLTKNQDFQKIRAALRGESEKAKQARAQIEGEATDKGRAEKQAALDKSAAEGRAMLEGVAKTDYEEAAARALLEENQRRDNLAKQIAAGNLDEESRAAALAKARQLAGSDEGAFALLSNLISGKGYGDNKTIDEYNKIAREKVGAPDDALLRNAFGVNQIAEGTPLSSFLDEPRRQEYGNIMSVLGKSVAGPQAISPAMQIDDSKLGNYLQSGLGSLDAAKQGLQQYEAQKKNYEIGRYNTLNDVYQQNAADDKRISSITPQLEKLNTIKNPHSTGKVLDEMKKVLPIKRNESGDEYLNRFLQTRSDLQNQLSRINKDKSDRLTKAKQALQMSAQSSFGGFNPQLLETYLKDQALVGQSPGSPFSGIGG